MPFRGRKVADIYAELSLDNDTAKRMLQGVPAALGGDADRAGQELGKRVTDGLARAVEASGARLVKARREEEKATDAVKLAQLRLNEAREKGNQRGSVLLALEQKLAQAVTRLGDANTAAARAVDKHAEAERRLATEMDNIGRNAGPNAERAGADLGGKLSQGIHLSIVRNSPLIVAAVAGALAVGAPVALAGATALFGGIGIVAATQSARVRTAWVSTWQDIRTSAVQDAAPVEAVLVRLADRVQDRFASMRPQLAGIFIDVAPQIDMVAEGLLDLADNALPGFERAIDRGRPVTAGFAEFLSKTGTGLTGMLDAISSRAPQAGAAFGHLGDTMNTLLPLVGEFLGQGAELATIMLPLLNTGLGLVLTTTRALGPALPPIVTGLAAMKIAQLAGGWFGGLTDRVGGFITRAGETPGVMGKMNAGLSSGIALLGGPWGAALAGAGALLAIFTADIQKNTEVEQRWAAELRKGGDDAKRVMAEAAAEADKYSDNWFGALSRTLDQWAGLSPTIEDAEAANREYFASLDPITAAEEQLAAAIATHGGNSDEAKAAQERLNQVTHEAARAQEAHELALEGVTQAMLDQLDQIRSAADAEFAHRQAVEGSSDAFTTYTEAVRDHGRGSEEARDAAMGFESALRAEADAASRLATDALPATASETDRLNAANVGHLGKLYELERKYGNDLPAAMRHEIQTMESSMSAAQRAGAQFASLGLSILNVPNSKTVIVSSTTPEQQAMLEKLGFTVTHLPDKTVQITANTAQAEQAMNHTARPRSTVVYSHGDASHGEQVLNWSARHRNALISAGADVANAERHLAWVARNRTVTIWTNTVTDRKDGGPIIKAAGGRKVRGPGGPREDRVVALGPEGLPNYRLSAGEWIVNELRARQQGDAKMQALNDGRATIVPVAPRSRAMAMAMTGRGSAAPRSAGAAAQPALGDAGMGMARPMAAQAVGAEAREYHLHLHGLDWNRPEDRRRMLREFRSGVIDLEREDR